LLSVGELLRWCSVALHHWFESTSLWRVCVCV